MSSAEEPTYEQVWEEIDNLFPENGEFQQYPTPDETKNTPNDEEKKVQKNVIATDFLTLEEVKVGDYIDEDPDNIVIKEGDTYILTKKSRVIELIQNHEAIIYPCAEKSDAFSVEPGNIYDFPLFWLRSVGGYNAVTAASLYVMMRFDSTQQVQVTKDVNVTFPQSASFSFVHNPGSDIVGVNHCQSGTDMKLQTIHDGELVDGLPSSQTGGKKKRRRRRSLRKRKKGAKKGRKTARKTHRRRQ